MVGPLGISEIPFTEQASNRLNSRLVRSGLWKEILYGQSPKLRQIDPLCIVLAWPRRHSIAMASEIGLLSKRLLTTCTIRNSSLHASQAFRQPLWAHPRAFATSSILSAPPRSGPRSNLEGLFSKPSPTNYAQPPPPPPAADAAAASQEKSDSPYAYDATSDTFDISKIIAMESDEFLKKHYPTSKQEPDLRTRPQTGRTVHLTSKTDLAKALKLLDFNCRKNKIKRQFQLQKFHERPGKKRKRQKSERWRARFKEGFKATVARVMELKNQGW